MSCGATTRDCPDIDLGTAAAGSTYRLRFPITKDGTAWTGIDSVSVYLTDPSGNTSAALTGVPETPDAGVWYYDTTTTDLDEAGDWFVSVKVTDGSVVSWYQGDITLTVVVRP